MYLFDLFLRVGILWFLITLFSRQTNASTSLTETWIVIAASLFVGILTRIGVVALLLYAAPSNLGVGALVRYLLLGPLPVIIHIIVLYFLIDKVCGTTRKTTIKICGWYLGISILLGLVSLLLTHVA
jgi:hypothetical protein